MSASPEGAATPDAQVGHEPLDDPLARFGVLLAAAVRVDRERLPEPTAFSLGTVDDEGRPSVRMLLLKGVDAEGFVFYTNFESRKGVELRAHPHAALCFHWQPLERQVRIEGPVEPVSAAEADAYFASRPRGSQLGAWASRQSRPMRSMATLEEELAEIERKFAGGAVPRPPHWSGFRLRPERMEFWRNMPSRLHERQLYTRTADGWRMQWLYP